jgi:hypothetical protein
MSENVKEITSADLIAKLRNELASNKANQLSAKTIVPVILLSFSDTANFTDDLIVSAEGPNHVFITEFESFKAATDAIRAETQGDADNLGPSWVAAGGGGFLTDDLLVPGEYGYGTNVSNKGYGDFKGGQGGFIGGRVAVAGRFTAV